MRRSVLLSYLYIKSEVQLVRRFAYLKGWKQEEAVSLVLFEGNEPSSEPQEGTAPDQEMVKCKSPSSNLTSRL